MVTIGEPVEGREGGIGRMGLTYTHYRVKQTINKNLPYGTGKSTQYFVITYIRKRTDIFIRIAESLCCTPETQHSTVLQ